MELFIPDLARNIEPTSIKFLAQEQFFDLTSGDKKIIDLLADVKLSGQEAGILIHVEAQATSASDFSRRMFFYFARLYQKYLRNVYPVVIFSFDQPQREESNSHIVTINNFKILAFNFESIQLNRLNWRDYLDQNNPVAAALMAKMKIAAEDRPKVKAECLRMITTLSLNPAQTQLISGFVDTYLKLNPQDERRFQQEIGRMETSQQERVMQIVTSWMEQGIEQGIAQGEKQGAHAVILRLIQRKFGQIPANINLKIQALSFRQTEVLSESLLDFSTLQDLMHWLDQNSDA